LEFKLDETAAVAMQQIEQKGYIDKYKNQGKQIIALGINFSSTNKNVDDWEIKKY